jgi:hypothetical protein
MRPNFSPVHDNPSRLPAPGFDARVAPTNLRALLSICIGSQSETIADL